MQAANLFNEDGIQTYLKEVGNHHILTREEEVALFERIENGDDSAREELVECNLRLVIKIALQFKNNGVPISDLIQEGNIGLLNVIDKFDYRKGFRFSTYAAYWIRQEIQAAVRSNNSMIRLPIRKSRLIGKISEFIRHFNSMEGRDPKEDEIAFHLDEPVEKIKMLLPYREGVASLDEVRNEDGSRLMDRMVEPGPAPSAKIMEVQGNTVVRAMLDGLSDREREVVRYRFGFETGKSLSLRKTSKKVGLSQEGVRRVEKRALEKLHTPAMQGGLGDLLTA